MTLPVQVSATTQDVQLLQAIVRRDQDALLTLYRLYGNPVYSLALRILRQPHWAEEVTQDIFLKVWQNPERWNPALGQFASWLLTITRNGAIDRLRKERRQLFDLLSLELEEELEQHTVIGQSKLHTDSPLWYDGQHLANLLSQLPPEQQTLIELAFYQGYTHSELSESLSLPLGTVKTRLRTGLQRLRRLWEESTQEGKR